MHSSNPIVPLTVGLTEAEAVRKYGADKVKVYTSGFANLWYGPFDLTADEKPKTNMKLVTLLPEERVIGIHMIGGKAYPRRFIWRSAYYMSYKSSECACCIYVGIHIGRADNPNPNPNWYNINIT